MTIKEYIANEANYGGKRTGKVEYLVIHYTGNNGDSDENNGKYFHNNIVKASAHYFVDSDSITRSVPEDHVAYAVGGYYGGGKYYGKCTNANSISIELCDDVKDGVVYPSAKTIENALELTRELMAKYNIPKENVIRHYDVNGKKCPAYWVKNSEWKKDFWNKLGTISAPTPVVKATVKALSGLVMRDASGNKIMTIPNKKKVTVVKKNAKTMKIKLVNYKMTRVKYASTTGYVATKYLKF